MERAERDFFISVSSVASCEKVTVTIEGRVSSVDGKNRDEDVSCPTNSEHRFRPDKSELMAVLIRVPNLVGRDRSVLRSESLCRSMNKRHKNRRADNFSRKWQLGRLIFLYYRKCTASLFSKQQLSDVGSSGICGMSCAVFVGNCGNEHVAHGPKGYWTKVQYKGSSAL